MSGIGVTVLSDLKEEKNIFKNVPLYLKDVLAKNLRMLLATIILVTN